MKKKQIKKEKKNQVVEIHIYVHQVNPNNAGCGSGVWTCPPNSTNKPYQDPNIVLC